MTAKRRYDELSGERSQFLNVAEQAADLLILLFLTSFVVKSRIQKV